MNNELQDIILGNQQLPDCVDNAVKNLTDKPSQSIGQTISDLWQLVLGGRVAFAAEKQKLKYAHDLEAFRISLESKVDAIPVQKQITPPLQIAAQALDDSKYCVESEELRDMFSSLIANSMNRDYSSILHPSFSKIIQQMSPLDAHMLRIIHKWQSRGGIAVVSYRRKIGDSGQLLITEYVPAEMPEGCSPQHAARALVSLQHLGLIQIPEGTSFVEKSRYKVFQETPLYEEVSRDAKIRGYAVETEESLAKLTVLGKDFVSVCLP